MADDKKTGVSLLDFPEIGHNFELVFWKSAFNFIYLVGLAENQD